MKDMRIRMGILWTLFGIFLGGFFGNVFGLSKTFIGTFTWIYVFGLSFLVLGLFVAAIMNNIRINKIRKKLKISKTEYNNLVNNYY